MNAILGTAGHIDHGKSQLVEALTGIQTDRLPEEQRRGISIELGFAWMELPDGGRAGIIDVPGHERFIRHMLAGAHGFDVVLLVVAADDGVMPQTEEHFEIVNLLGVERLVFVITKTDLADGARIEEVREELEILALETAYEEAPVVEVCARTGDGIEALRSLLLDELAQAQRSWNHDEPFRMPIDRVFSVRGHGAVVTGTALSGSVENGANLEVQPSGLAVRVREVQVHSDPVARAERGQRVALNLVGPGRDLIQRGDLIVTPGAYRSAECLDVAVEVRPIAGAALKSHQYVRLHLHTRDVRARLVWLENIREVAPRGRAFAQLIPAEPVVATGGDRFVLRDETGAQTLGGGQVILAPAPRRRGRQGLGVSPLLEDLAAGVSGKRLRALLRLGGTLTIAAERAARATGLSSEVLAREVADDDELAEIVLGEGSREIIAAADLQELFRSLDQAVEDHHRTHPEQAGVELELLRRLLPLRPEPGLFRSVLETLTSRGILERRGNLVLKPGHEVRLAGSDEVAAESLARLVAAGGVMPPLLRDGAVSLSLEVKKAATLASVLVERGDLIRVDSELFYAPEAMSQIEKTLRLRLAEAGEITAAEFRDLISASRKYCIPLLDYFDRCGVTIRVGDVRKLRASAS